jgi:hypothetical protein
MKTLPMITKTVFIATDGQAAECELDTAIIMQLMTDLL